MKKHTGIGLMETSYNDKQENPLETKPIWSLLPAYAIPSIAGLLGSAIYNITDQIFIGNIVGIYGNAATNVAFPLVMLVSAFAVLIGLGTASNFNLLTGAGKTDEASHFTGNAVSLSVLIGMAIMTLALFFLKPVLLLFGATENVLPFALDYTGIVAVGIPFFTFSTAMSYIIRADGKPRFSMIILLTGAILNVFLDALFMLVLKQGIEGAALATTISQIVSALIALSYLLKFRTVSLRKETFRIRWTILKQIAKLGIAYFFFQFVIMFSQVVLNNMLIRYGALSVYGSDIPLAVVAVVSKSSVLFQSILQGIGQSTQPIFGFNYGAKRYDRVKETYWKALSAALFVSFVAFVVFQVFPRQILSIFGDGGETYFLFGERYMRIFMMMLIIAPILPLSGQLFTSTGRAGRGLLIFLSRQGYFLVPLLFILPHFF
jgi:putative MATE family efflux protein